VRRAAPAALDDATLAFAGFGIVMPLEIVLILPRAAAVPVIFLGSERSRAAPFPMFPDAETPSA
jgi:hypothetical protein